MAGKVVQTLTINGQTVYVYDDGSMAYSINGKNVDLHSDGTATGPDGIPVDPFTGQSLHQDANGSWVTPDGSPAGQFSIPQNLAAGAAAQEAASAVGGAAAPSTGGVAGSQAASQFAPGSPQMMIQTPAAGVPGVAQSMAKLSTGSAAMGGPAWQAAADVNYWKQSGLLPSLNPESWQYEIGIDPYYAGLAAAAKQLPGQELYTPDARADQANSRAQQIAAMAMLQPYATGEESVVRQQAEIERSALANRIASQVAGRAYDPAAQRGGQMAYAKGAAELGANASVAAAKERQDAINAMLGGAGQIRGADVSQFGQESALEKSLRDYEVQKQAAAAEQQKLGLGEKLAGYAQGQDWQKLNAAQNQWNLSTGLSAEGKNIQGQSNWGQVAGGVMGAIGGLAAMFSDKRTKCGISDANVVHSGEQCKQAIKNGDLQTLQTLQALSGSGGITAAQGGGVPSNAPAMLTPSTPVGAGTSTVAPASLGVGVSQPNQASPDLGGITLSTMNTATGKAVTAANGPAAKGKHPCPVCGLVHNWPGGEVGEYGHKLGPKTQSLEGVNFPTYPSPAVVQGQPKPSAPQQSTFPIYPTPAISPSIAPAAPQAMQAAPSFTPAAPQQQAFQAPQISPAAQAAVRTVVGQTIPQTKPLPAANEWKLPEQPNPVAGAFDRPELRQLTSPIDKNDVLSNPVASQIAKRDLLGNPVELQANVLSRAQINPVQLLPSVATQRAYQAAGRDVVYSDEACKEAIARGDYETAAALEAYKKATTPPSIAEVLGEDRVGGVKQNPSDMAGAAEKSGNPMLAGFWRGFQKSGRANASQLTPSLEAAAAAGVGAAGEAKAEMDAESAAQQKAKTDAASADAAFEKRMGDAGAQFAGQAMGGMPRLDAGASMGDIGAAMGGAMAGGAANRGATENGYEGEGGGGESWMSPQRAAGLAQLGSGIGGIISGLTPQSTWVPIRPVAPMPISNSPAGYAASALLSDVRAKEEIVPARRASIPAEEVVRARVPLRAFDSYSGPAIPESMVEGRSGMAYAPPGEPADNAPTSAAAEIANLLERRGGMARRRYDFSDSPARVSLSRPSVESFMDNMEAKTYRYKPPFSDMYGTDRKLGVIAQDVAKSEIGKNIVFRDPRTGMLALDLSMQKFGPVALASFANLNDRLSRLESKGGK